MKAHPYTYFDRLHLMPLRAGRPQPSVECAQCHATIVADPFDKPKPYWVETTQTSWFRGDDLIRHLCDVCGMQAQAMHKVAS